MTFGSLSLALPLLHIHNEAHADEGSFWQELPCVLGDVLASTLEITGLVILMMSVIELINVSSAGKWMAKLHDRPFLQVVIACLLGVIPGCAGGFAVVSMFTHNLLTFGALVGGMVATFGDEAFFLFAQDPKSAMLLSGVLFGLGIAVGVVVNMLGKKWNPLRESHEFEIHKDDEHEEHHHAAAPTTGMMSMVRHFFIEHVWEHVIKKHLLSIFLWSFGVLLFLHVVEFFFDLEMLMHTHQWAKYVLLLAAVLIGLIPESGPHLIFIMMFLEGTIPFGIVLANSIAQNGHAGLPLLAQSRKNFFVMKGITMLLGLLCGLLLIL